MSRATAARLGSWTRLLLAVVMSIAVVPIPMVSADARQASRSATCFGRAPTITKGTGNNRIVGTAGNDVIMSGGGDDTVYGRGGNDLICAGPGADEVFGGDGNDRIAGAGGRDRLIGGDGNDRIEGGDQTDRLSGGIGHDQIFGGDGNDQMFGGAHNDALRGWNGNDSAEGGTGADLIDGGPGANRAAGEKGRDSCFSSSSTGCEKTWLVDFPVPRYSQCYEESSLTSMNGDYWSRSFACEVGDWAGYTAFIEFNLGRDHRRLALTLGQDDSSNVTDCQAQFTFKSGSQVIYTVVISYGTKTPVTLDVTDVLRLRVEITTVANCSAYYTPVMASPVTSFNQFLTPRPPLS